MKKCAALLYGRDDGHLDHLAPYSSLLDIPLFITDQTLYEFASNQYPDLHCILSHPNEVASLILENFDHLITTLPKEIINPIFMFDELHSGKKLTTSWLPHGASDKKNMDALISEDHLLVYGDKMISMLSENMKEKAQKIGNYRRYFYESHKAFYDHLLNQLQIDFSQPTHLYAPSWEYDEIKDWINVLIKQKPKNHNLLIKLHPNTYQKGIGQTLIELYKDEINVFFIKDFFPIYPLLSKTSTLYTDISSIGYDFLSFDRPLFFTCSNDDPLHQCGIEIDLENAYPNQEIKEFATLRQNLSHETFESIISCKPVLHHI